ncbi:MAG: methyltransferase domain-containing protein [Mariprofundaceae bacterium]|nr:methyltransferase domain-containing protein [Mariprofundaceae bacterium]
MTNLKLYDCPICGSTNVTVYDIQFPQFLHMDFSVFDADGGQIGCCKTCGAIFRKVDESQAAKIEAIYTSTDYAQHDEPHTLKVEEYSKPVSLGFLQAELLKGYLPKQNVAILDIGCFDGKLLRELGHRCDAIDLCGFDVAVSPKFPKEKPFRFVSDDFKNIQGQFDLVVLSQSLQYIRDTTSLFEQIKSLLKPTGVLFVHVPNYLAKPCSLLLGDLFTHYTPENLSIVFAKAGFNFSLVKNSWFPRDIISIGYFHGDVPAVAQTMAGALEQTLDKITKLSTVARDLSLEQNFGVLGTTIEAAFIKSQLGHSVACFVDENPKKVGGTFYGCPIVHPRDLSDSDTVFIPIIDTGVSLQDRLDFDYRAKFILPS